MSEVEAGDPGEAIQCLDVRTGGSFRFQAQRLLGSGVLDTTWTPDSSPVCVGSAEGLAQRLIPDGTGGAFVAWVDHRDGLPDARLSRVDAQGAPMAGWNIEGLTLSPFRASRDHVTGCADGAGGAYVAWSEFRGAATSCIRLVRVGADGALLPGWPSGGVLVGSGGREQAHPAVAAVTGGVVVTWLERQSGRLGLRIQRLGADGIRAAGWGEEGTEVVAPPVSGHVSHHQVLARSGGDLRIVWREEHAEGAAAIQAASVGISTPPAGAVAARQLSGEAVFQSEPAVVASAGHIFVAWTEQGSGSEGAYLQRLTASGEVDPLWPATGVLVAQTSVGLDPPAILPESGGGALLAWTDRREIASGDIYAGRVLGDGTVDPNWPASGTPVCTALGDQFRPTLAPDGSGGAIVSWLDATNGAVAGFLTASLQAIGPVELVETTLDPGRVRLTWTAPASAELTYRAYRRLERAAWSLVAELTPEGSGRLTVDDRAAPEGRSAEYALSIERGGVERFLAPVAVSVPATPERLAFKRVSLSTTGDAIRVEFALPRGPEARLELIDVAGRRIGDRRLSGYEPGERVAEVRGRGRVRAGVYFVRLHQGAVVLTQKFVAVR